MRNIHKQNKNIDPLFFSLFQRKCRRQIGFIERLKGLVREQKLEQEDNWDTGAEEGGKSRQSPPLTVRFSLSRGVFPPRPSDYFPFLVPFGCPRSSSCSATISIYISCGLGVNF